MDLVLDTSAIIAVIANEPERDSILRATQGMNFIAPLSVHWEVGNAFSAMLRRGRTSLPAVQRGLELYARIPLRFVDVGLQDAVKLAASLNIYAYDAYVLVCAQQRRAHLLTLDNALQAHARAARVALLELNS